MFRGDTDYYWRERERERSELWKTETDRNCIMCSSGYFLTVSKINYIFLYHCYW